MDQMEVIKIVNRKMKPKEQIIKIKMKESLQQLPKLFPRGKKSPREKMREMVDKRKNKKLTKSVPVDRQLIALHKEEMGLKREMLRKMNYQEQQF